MTNLQPKVNIDKFSGMSDMGGVFYVDGFSVENENGVFSFDENYTAKELIDASSGDFVNFNKAKTMLHINAFPSSTLGSISYTLLHNGSYFFIASESLDVYNGKISEVPLSGFIVSSKPDLFQLPSGNILFTSGQHMGLIVRGLCKSGSGTTKIIDKSGRDFSSLGLSSSSPNNKAFNLKNGKEYTITSISTTNSTNDTLNFSAGDDNKENDEFVAFIYTKWNLNTDITVPAFIGQPPQNKWARQIKQLAIGDRYYIANGNMLAWLDGDEETLYTKHEVGENKGKLLPIGYQLVAFEVNGGTILASATDQEGKGHLLLWDGYSDGWNIILNLNSAPLALHSSGSGWIYLLDGVIYFTDGYNIQPLIAYPEKNRDAMLNTTGFNAITSLNNKYYFCVESPNNSTRSLTGILVFDPNSGLSVTKVKGLGTTNRIPYCVKVNSNSNINTDKVAKPIIEVCGEFFYNQLLSYEPNTSSKDFKSFVYFIDFGREIQLNLASLSIKRSSKAPLKERNSLTEISVNYGDNRLPILSYGKANVSAVDKIENVNGDKYPGEVGQEIEFTSGDVSGQRTFIKSISGGGTVSEEWEIEPELSDIASDCEYRAWGLKNGQTKAIDLNKQRIQENFAINFIGDKLWLEVVIRGKEGSFPVSIDKIALS